MINEDYIKTMIKKHEGFRGEVYKDSVGVLTGGWGHAFHVGSRLSAKVTAALFEEDYENAQTDVTRFLSMHRLWDLSEIRTAVLIDMMFNLGYVKLNKFKKFIAAMVAEDYETAAMEMENSKWARQVGYRAKKLSKMMGTGRI